MANYFDKYFDNEVEKEDNNLNPFDKYFEEETEVAKPFGSMNAENRRKRLEELETSVATEWEEFKNSDKFEAGMKELGIPGMLHGLIKKTATAEDAFNVIKEQRPHADLTGVFPKDLGELLEARKTQSEIADAVPLGDKVEHAIGRVSGSITEGVGMTLKGLDSVMGGPPAIIEEAIKSAGKDVPPSLLEMAGEGLNKRADRVRETTEHEDLVGDFLLDTLTSAGGQLVPQLATGGPLRAAAQGALVQGQSTYERALAEGASEEDAKWVGIFGGLLGLSEAALPSRIFKGLDDIPKGAKDRLLSALESAGAEAGTEISVGILEQTALNLVVDEENKQDILDGARAAHEGGAGAILGFLLDLGTRGTRARRPREQAIEFQGEATLQQEDADVPTTLREQREATPEATDIDITLQEDADFTSFEPSVVDEMGPNASDIQTDNQVDELNNLIENQEVTDASLEPVNTALQEGVEFDVVPPRVDPFVAKEKKTRMDSLRQKWSRYVTKRHGLPKSIYEDFIFQQGSETAEVIAAEDMAKNIDKVMSDFKIEPLQVKRYMEGKSSNIDANMKGMLDDFKEIITGNDLQLRKRGVLPPRPKKLTPEEQLDFVVGRLDEQAREDYIHREYGIFSYKGKDWLEYQRKNNPQSIERLRDFIASEKGSQYFDRKANETEMAIIEELARAGKSSGRKSYRDLTGQDRGALKKRKDLPPELREFWGENTDVGSIISRTIEVQNLLLSRDTFHRKLVEAGLQEGWAFQGRKEGFLPLNEQFKYIKGHPLHDISVDPDIKRAIEDSQGLQELFLNGVIDPDNETFITQLSKYSSLGRTIGDLSGLVKAILTVGNPASHVKNHVSAPIFLMAQGTNVKHLGKGYAAALAQRRHKFNEGLTSSKDLDMINDLTKYRIADESALGEEAYQALEQVLARVEKAASDGTKKAKIKEMIRSFLEKPGKYATAWYQTADTAARAAVFYSEIDVLKKAYPNKTDEQIKREAAMVARDTIPTYSNVPMWTKFFRNKMLGTFMAFNYEVARTFVQTQKRAAKEIASGNKTLQARGVKRLLSSNFMYGTTGYGISWAGAMIWNSMVQYLGIEDELTDEEYEARDAWRQPWSRGNKMIYIDKDTEFDLSNFLPMNVTESFFAELLDKGVTPTGVKEATKSFLAPYIDKNLGGMLAKHAFSGDVEEMAKLLIPNMIRNPYNTLATALDERRDEGELRRQIMKLFVGSPSTIDVEKQMITRDLPDYFTALDIYTRTDQWRVIYDERATQEEMNAAVLEYARIQQRQQQILMDKIATIENLDEHTKINRKELLQVLTNPTKLKGLRGNTDAFFEGSHAVGGNHRLSKAAAIDLMNGRTHVRYPSDQSLKKMKKKQGPRHAMKVKRAIFAVKQLLNQEREDATSE